MGVSPTCPANGGAPIVNPNTEPKTTEIWTLIPGKDYSNGNGILLKLHGMVVDVLSPPAHLKTAAVEKLKIEANVAKMCGCPLARMSWLAPVFNNAASC